MKIYGSYPRGANITNSIENTFIAYGLDEFEVKYILYGKLKDVSPETPHYIMIDMANGHMLRLKDTIIKTRELGYTHDELVLMVGNIAHPQTYRVLANAGADYVRLGIGSGQICTSSANTSIHFPLASLIDECNAIKREGFKTKIVADGGFKNFDEIIKALGLGADLVMCGSIFNKALESSGKTSVKGSKCIVDQFSKEIKQSFKNGLELTKEYYGMSTKRAQKEMGHEKLKTAEGIAKINSVDYTIDQWTENFQHYIRSAMSYTGKKTLQEFIGGVDFQVITPQAFQAFIK